jgi:hypothetical protein
MSEIPHMDEFAALVARRVEADKRRAEANVKHAQECAAIERDLAQREGMFLWKIWKFLDQITVSPQSITEFAKEPEAAAIIEMLSKQLGKALKANNDKPLSPESTAAQTELFYKKRKQKSRGIRSKRRALLALEMIIKGENTSAEGLGDVIAHVHHLPGDLPEVFLQKAREMAKAALEKEPDENEIYHTLYRAAPEREGEERDVKYTCLAIYLRQWLAGKTRSTPVVTDFEKFAALLDPKDRRRIYGDVGGLPEPEMRAVETIQKGLETLARPGTPTKENRKLLAQIDRQGRIEILDANDRPAERARYFLLKELIRINAYLDGMGYSLETPRHIDKYIVRRMPEAFGQLHREGIVRDEEFRTVAASGGLGMKVRLKGLTRFWSKYDPAAENKRVGISDGIH